MQTCVPLPLPSAQLIKSGERDRLKALLREKLTECGWRDDIKQRCRGERPWGLLLRRQPAGAPAHPPSPPPPLHPRTRPHHPAEYISGAGRENVSTDEIVRAVRPEGRATVPDAVKAELLSKIKEFILHM